MNQGLKSKPECYTIRVMFCHGSCIDIDMINLFPRTCRHDRLPHNRNVHGDRHLLDVRQLPHNDTWRRTMYANLTSYEPTANRGRRRRRPYAREHPQSFDDSYSIPKSAMVVLDRNNDVAASGTMRESYLHCKSVARPLIPQSFNSASNLRPSRRTEPSPLRQTDLLCYHICRYFVRRIGDSEIRSTVHSGSLLARLPRNHLTSIAYFR